MPTYVMQSCVLLKNICEDIDKKCRSFLCRDTDNHKKMHLLNWDDICTPKSEGGLGLRKTSTVNNAFMLKSIWNLCNKQNSLWVDTIRGKYNFHREGLPRVNITKSGSNFWRGLCKNWEKFQKHIIWKLGNGESIRLWEDSWMPQLGNLKDLATQGIDCNTNVVILLTQMEIGTLGN